MKLEDFSTRPSVFVETRHMLVSSKKKSYYHFSSSTVHHNVKLHFNLMLATPRVCLVKRRGVPPLD